MEIALRGIGVSPGIAIGPVLAYGVKGLDIPKQPVDDPEAELARFDQAVAAVRLELQSLLERTTEILGEKHAAIFKAHLLILDDVVFRDEIVSDLKDTGLNVEFLVQALMVRYTEMLKGVDDPSFQERARDFLDVGERIQRKLLNADVESLEHLARPSVIVSQDLAPSDTAKMDMVNTLGIATDMSGPTSHTAILARALELPAVVGLKFVGSHSHPGDTIIVDGSKGDVIIRPTEDTLRRYTVEKRRVEQGQRKLLETESDNSITADGHACPTMANIELPIELSHAVKARAEGIGLYRTEYLFLNRSEAPTEEEQLESYAEVAREMAPLPVTLRTLDVGGDKLAAYLPQGHETNPQLGWRSIRFCLGNLDLFKTQLRAMLRASAQGNVRIMFPLISGIEELRQAREVVRDACAELEKEGIPFDKEVKVGTMIEVPSAVEVATDLAKECDFFSIGTNDLIQYALAVDRGNENVAHLYEPAHPAVLGMVRRTVTAAKAADIPCTVCGEMAGDPLFSELLIGIGVSGMSMSPVSIPRVRAEIANINYRKALSAVKSMRRLKKAADIREAMTRYQRRRHTVDDLLNQLEQRLSESDFDGQWPDDEDADE